MRYSPDIDRLARQWDDRPDSRVFAALADGLRKFGAVEEADRVATAGVLSCPDYLPGHVVLAKIRGSRGDTVGASASLRRALTLDAEHPLARELLDALAANELPLLPASVAEERPGYLLPVPLVVSAAPIEAPAVHDHATNGYVLPGDLESGGAFLVDDGDEGAADADADVEFDHRGPMLSESLALLYQQQGHLDRALEAFDALVARAPLNALLVARRDAIRDELERQRPRPFLAEQSGGRPVGEWLAAIAAVRAPAPPPLSSFDAFYETPPAPQPHDNDFAAFQAWLKELER